MARYDVVYDVLATRAVQSAVIDIEAFIARAEATGMSFEAIASNLITDFENDGPLFGRYLRSVTGAGNSSVRAAVRQGEIAGTILSDPRVMRELSPEAAEQLELYDVEDVIAGADPEQLARLEEIGENISVTWVAMLASTCHRCLPLHGQTRTRREWALKGLDPETIHDGWVSECKCRLVPAAQTTGRKDITEPLRRVKLPEGERRAGRKTARDVTQTRLEAAQAAAEKAMETPEGRRAMRILGSSGNAD